MKTPSRIAMKIFVSALKNKKDATEKEKGMAEKMASSYDISDIKYIEPIVMYLGEKTMKKLFKTFLTIVIKAAVRDALRSDH